MPTYSGSFPLAAEGLAVTVKTAAGVALTDPAPGVVGTTQTDDGALAYSYVYADGDDGTVLTASVSSSALGTFSTSLVLDTAASLAAGGGATETGDGPPGTDPEVAGAGAQYIDTTNGALYLVANNPAEDELQWNVIGEIDGANEAQGVVLGAGIAVLGKSLGAAQVVISDVDAYNDSGNGVIWRGTGTDGEQTFEVRVGPVGTPVVLKMFADGEVDLPGQVYADGGFHATTALSTKGAAAPADGDIQSGQCFMFFDSSNGAAKVKFKGKSADGTVVAGEVALT